MRFGKAALPQEREDSITSEALGSDSSMLASTSLPPGAAVAPSRGGAMAAPSSAEFLCVTVREARNLVGKFQSTANP